MSSSPLFIVDPLSLYNLIVDGGVVVAVNLPGFGASSRGAFVSPEPAQLTWALERCSFSVSDGAKRVVFAGPRVASVEEWLRTAHPKVMMLHCSESALLMPMLGSLEAPRLPEWDALRTLPHLILPRRLYLGSYASEHNPLLRSLGIRSVVNASGLPSTKRMGMRYCQVKVADSVECNISKHFERVATFIDQAERRGHATLVHCLAGVSRSATLILAFLMLRRGLCLRDAWRTVHGHRSVVQPNPGFVKQLIALEQRLFGATTSDAQPLHFH